MFFLTDTYCKYYKYLSIILSICLNFCNLGFLHIDKKVKREVKSIGINLLIASNYLRYVFSISSKKKFHLKGSIANAIALPFVVLFNAIQFI